MHIASRDEPVSGTNHGAPGRSLPGSLTTGKTMNRHSHATGEFPRSRRSFRFSLVLPVLFTIAILIAGCSSSAGSVKVSPEDREAAFRQIAADYVANGNLAAVQTALDKLDLANPGQLIVALAEADVNAGKPKTDVEPLARLANALGARSPRLEAYLQPTVAPIASIAPTAAPRATQQLPTATTAPLPTTEPSPATTATAAPTEVPTTQPTDVPPSATPAPQKPRVLAENTVNLRSGPDRTYPVIGRLNAGQEVDIVGRNASGDWWRLAWSGNGQAWVAGTVVRVLGAIDTIAEVKDVPPAPTAAPRPTSAPVAAQPTTPPKVAGPDFRLESIRVWGVQENGGWYDGSSVHCGEKRELRVIALDAAGNRLDGVTIKMVYGSQEEKVTGSKGPGEAEFVLGLGQDAYVIRDIDGRQVTSDVARGMSTNPAAISYDVLMGGGFCRDAADCAHFVSQNGCYGHYSWTVTFRRAY
jgi:uncharacterized protein YraI